jgi:replicative DNA helicase
MHREGGIMLAAPNNENAENGVLSALLGHYDQAVVYQELSRFLLPEHFFILRNKWIWQAYASILSRHELLDPITVSAELLAMGHEDITYHLMYLQQLFQDSNTAYSLARLVWKLAIKREVICLGQEFIQMGESENIGALEVIDLAESELGKITMQVRQVDTKGLKPIIEIIDSNTDDMATAYSAYQEGKTLGYGTGFAELDHLFRLIAGMLITIAARPRVGKSALMQSIIYNHLMLPFVSEHKPLDRAFIQLGHSKRYLLAPSEYELAILPRLVLFSTEMTPDQNINRFAAMITGVPVMKQITGEMSYTEFSDVTHAKNLIGSLGDRLLLKCGAMTPGDMHTQIRLWRPDVVFSDYLQRFNVPSTIKANNDVERINYVSQAHKDIAMEENICIVTGAQVNREGSSAPSLETLKGSGKIEEDSDIVLFIHRDELYNSNSNRQNEADILIEKNRNGATDKVVLYYAKTRTLFKKLDKVSIDSLYSK